MSVVALLDLLVLLLLLLLLDDKFASLLCWACPSSLLGQGEGRCLWKENGSARSATLVALAASVLVYFLVCDSRFWLSGSVSVGVLFSASSVLVALMGAFRRCYAELSLLW